jgi:glutamate 5-kinase
LAVGVKKVLRVFVAGEVFEILDEKGTAFAVAKSKLDSKILSSDTKKQNLEIAHADDIVLL